jgi:hypothetical protein
VNKKPAIAMAGFFMLLDLTIRVSEPTICHCLSVDRFHQMSEGGIDLAQEPTHPILDLLLAMQGCGRPLKSQ